MRCQLNFDELRLFPPRYTGGPQTTSINPELSSQWFAYPYFCPWWPVAPGRRPEHPPSDGHWLGSAILCYFETNRRFINNLYWPTILTLKKKNGGIHKKTEKNQGLSWADAGGPARGWADPGRPAWPGPIFYMMGRGPARPIKFNLVGRGPPSIFRGWAATRPGPLIFQKIGRGPAQPITFSKIHGRPGPAHHFLKSLGPARPGPSHGSEAHETPGSYGPARQLPGPARGFDGPARVSSRTIRCICILR